METLIPLVTTGVAARRLGVSIQAFYGWMRAGKIRPAFIDSGKRRLFTEREIERFAAEREVLLAERLEKRAAKAAKFTRPDTLGNPE